MRTAKHIQDFCLFILQWSVFQSGLQSAERTPSAAVLHRRISRSMSDHWPAIHSSSLSIKDFALHIIFQFISERSSLEAFDMGTCLFASMKKNVWGPPWMPEWLDAWSPFDSLWGSRNVFVWAPQNCLCINTKCLRLHHPSETRSTRQRWKPSGATALTVPDYLYIVISHGSVLADL